MSEADFPNRPLGQNYSPISKYGQISIAEQLARLEEIRTGGRRPAYRPQTPSLESQWGQIQEGFSQVEDDVAWQLRQEPADAEPKSQRQLSPDQDGRSWVQEYREKQQMRKVAQEARERAEADLQRLLKEREEAQAYAREQERLAAEAAERLRQLEDAEQEALRSAAREQQRREQRVLNTQVAEEKSEAEKMAELLASFQNLQAVAGSQQPAGTPTSPAVAAGSDVSTGPAPRATAGSPVVSQPVPQLPVPSLPSELPGTSLPRSAPQEPSAPLPPGSQPPSSRQLPVETPRAQGGPTFAPAVSSGQPDQQSSRIFGDIPGSGGQHSDTQARAPESFSGVTPAVGEVDDADTTQPVKVVPIDSLADSADDRALADSLASAARDKSSAATRPAPAPGPAAAMPVTGPANAAPAPSSPAASLVSDQASVAGAPAAFPRAITLQASAPAAARVDADSLSAVKLAAGQAGSAAELFQQALEQTKLGVAGAAATAPASASSAADNANQASMRPAPAPSFHPSSPAAPVPAQEQVFSAPRPALAQPVAAPEQPTPAPAPAPMPAPMAATAQPVVPAATATPTAPAPAATVPAGTQTTYVRSEAPGNATPVPATATPSVATATPAVSPAAVAPAAEVPERAVPASVTSAEKPSDEPASSAESEPPQEEKTRWWQRKKQAKKAEAPEQEDTRAGAWQESAEAEGEEEPLTFIQTFLRWVLRLSILLIIALGMVLTMDRPVISQTMGQDILQAGIVDNVSVTQI